MRRAANRALTLAKGFAIFLVALAVSALASIDDVEPVQPPVEAWQR